MKDEGRREEGEWRGKVRKKEERDRDTERFPASGNNLSYVLHLAK